MKPVRQIVSREQIEFFVRRHGPREGLIQLPRPPPPPFDIETMEPIEPPWLAIKEWIPDDEPDLDFSPPSGPPQRLFQGPPAQSKFLAADFFVPRINSVVRPPQNRHQKNLVTAFRKAVYAGLENGNFPDPAGFRRSERHSSFQCLNFGISALPKLPYSPATPFFPPPALSTAFIPNVNF
jgi:hypothetical protein